MGTTPLGMIAPPLKIALLTWLIETAPLGMIFHVEYRLLNADSTGVVGTTSLG
jgi:hypothetical protein